RGTAHGVELGPVPQDHAIARVSQGQGAGRVGADPVAFEEVEIGRGFEQHTLHVAGDEVAADQRVASGVGEPNAARTQVGDRRRAGGVGADVVVLDGVEVGVVEGETGQGVAADDVAVGGRRPADRVARGIHHQHAAAFVAQARNAIDVGADVV